MKKKLIIAAAVTACVSITGCTASFDREVKSFSSNWNGVDMRETFFGGE